MEHIVKINIPKSIPTNKLKNVDEPELYVLKLKIKILCEHNANDILKQKIFDLLPHNSCLSNAELMSLGDNMIKTPTLHKLIKDANNSFLENSACITKYIKDENDTMISKLINSTLEEMNKRTVACYTSDKFYVLYSISGLLFLTVGYYDTILEAIKNGPINYEEILFPIIKNNEMLLNVEDVAKINEGRLDKEHIDKINIQINRYMQIYSMTITTPIKKNKINKISGIDDVIEIINIKYVNKLVEKADEELCIGEELKYGAFRFGKYYFLSLGYETT